MNNIGNILNHQQCPARTIQERVLCRRQETGDNIKKNKTKTELETFGNDHKTSCEFPQESTEVHENFPYYTYSRFSVYEFKTIQIAANHADKIKRFLKPDNSPTFSVLY